MSVQPENCMLEVLLQPCFCLPIPDGVGSPLTLKISAEFHLLEAGSGVLEGLDPLFKLFWVIPCLALNTC